MNHITPEQAGISSRDIMKYLSVLEKNRLATHDIIMARGNNVFFEAYWKPFNADFMHRMYSVSKSFVALAIGFLEQDGKISLDDKIEKYFAKDMVNQPDVNMRSQTIRHMLMMSTAKVERHWFNAKPSDRVRYYFENDSSSRPSGTIYKYDSSGSFVLGALVERVTGLELTDYLYEKLFSKIGVSKSVYCLKCPGGHSWGDSGIICTPTDLLLVARFVMNKGKWNGEQILNERFLAEATSRMIDNNDFTGSGNFNSNGYGYYFWKLYGDAYLFNGMGCQFAACIPEKDLIFIYNGDNQGIPTAKKTIIDSFFEMISDKMSDTLLLPDASASAELKQYSDNLKLISADGMKTTATAEAINGKTYILDENPMGITKFRLSFDKTQGKFDYTNEQGDKTILFGLCENVFDKFPQEGYSDEIGTVRTTGKFYNCAASGAWIEDSKIYIKVQIIDKYFGNLGVVIGFRDDICGLYMGKSAEDFLNEYQGYAGGKQKTQ